MIIYFVAQRHGSLMSAFKFETETNRFYIGHVRLGFQKHNLKETYCCSHCVPYYSTSYVVIMFIVFDNVMKILN